jgi:hypothetical protein
MVWHCDCSCDILLFTDGKPWKMNHPGRGDTAKAFARAVGVNDINLVQQAHYNGHYGFHGSKVQHVQQADGICYSLTCPLQHHDAVLLHDSLMVNMLPLLFVDNAPLRPVKCLLTFYGHTLHFCPLHTTVKLHLMMPV